jgi:hypothetical protein
LILVVVFLASGEILEMVVENSRLHFWHSQLDVEEETADLYYSGFQDMSMCARSVDSFENNGSSFHIKGSSVLVVDNPCYFVEAHHFYFVSFAPSSCLKSQIVLAKVREA